MPPAKHDMVVADSALDEMMFEGLVQFDDLPPISLGPGDHQPETVKVAVLLAVGLTELGEKPQEMPAGLPEQDRLTVPE